MLSEPVVPVQERRAVPHAGVISVLKSGLLRQQRPGMIKLIVAIRSDPDYLRDVQPDEARFADMSNTVFFVTEEELVLDNT
jgi:hypothetical protein